MYFNKLDCKMYIILFNIFVKTSCKNLHAFFKCQQNSPGGGEEITCYVHPVEILLLLLFLLLSAR